MRQWKHLVEPRIGPRSAWPAQLPRQRARQLESRSNSPTQAKFLRNPTVAPAFSCLRCAKYPLQNKRTPGRGKSGVLYLSSPPEKDFVIACLRNRLPMFLDVQIVNSRENRHPRACRLRHPPGTAFKIVIGSAACGARAGQTKPALLVSPRKLRANARMAASKDPLPLRRGKPLAVSSRHRKLPNCVPR